MGGGVSKAPELLYEKDTKTVLENLIDDMTIEKVLSTDAGVSLLYRHCINIGHKEVGKLLKYCFDFPKTFARLKGKELLADIELVVTAAFADDLVTRKIPETMQKVFTQKCHTAHAQLEDPSTAEGALNLRFLKELQTKLISGMVQDELESFKSSTLINSYIASTLTFNDVVSDDHLMLYFQKSSAKEYSSENVNFFESCRTYRKYWSADNEPANLKFATYITKMFIEEVAPLQVNVDSKMRRKIEKSVIQHNHARQEVFDDARKEIFLLMGRDAWARFKASPFLKEYLASNRPLAPDLNPLSAADSTGLRVAMFHEYIGDDDLDAVLSTRVGRDYLNKYVTMWQPDCGTIKFIEAVMDYEMLEVGQMQKRAKKIFSKFCGSMKTEVVDLPQNIVGALEQEVEVEPDAKTFKKAEIMLRKDLWKDGTFQNFKMTGLYTKYRLTVKK